jgi:hypothetical protein
MAQLCKICVNGAREAIDQLICSGVSDAQIGRRFGLLRVCVLRHRKNHLIPANQHRTAILEKERKAREERQQLAAAAAADTPSIEVLIEQNLSMRAQIASLSEVKADLRHGATIAREAGSPAAIAQVAGQQLRHVEVSSRLGGTGGYRQTGTEGGGGPGNRWSIQFHFASSGRTESINIVGPVSGNRSDDSDDSGDIIDGVAEA